MRSLEYPAVTRPGKVALGAKTSPVSTTPMTKEHGSRVGYSFAYHQKDPSSVFPEWESLLHIPKCNISMPLDVYVSSEDQMEQREPGRCIPCLLCKFASGTAKKRKIGAQRFPLHFEMAETEWAKWIGNGHKTLICSFSLESSGQRNAQPGATMMSLESWPKFSLTESGATEQENRWWCGFAFETEYRIRLSDFEFKIQN